MLSQLASRAVAAADSELASHTCGTACDLTAILTLVLVMQNNLRTQPRVTGQDFVSIFKREVRTPGVELDLQVRRCLLAESSV